MESIEEQGIVKSAGNTVYHCQSIPDITELILGRNLTVVRSVGNLFHANMVKKDT